MNGNQQVSQPGDEYARRILERRKISDRYGRLARWAKVAGYVMFAAFLASVRLAFDGAVGPAPILMSIALCAVFIKWRDRLLKTQVQMDSAVSFYEQGLRRTNGTWIGHGNTNSFADDTHLYARDLDVFGKGSLFELLCAARTYAGMTTLANWLCAASTVSETVERQQAVRELQSLIDLRESLATVRPTIQTRLEGSSLRRWTEESLPEEARVRRWIALILASLTISTLLMLPLFGYRAVPVLACAIVGEMAFSIQNYSRRRRVLDFTTELSEEFRTLRKTLSKIESQNFQAAKLLWIQGELRGSKEFASVRLTGLIKMLNLLERSMILWPITGFFLLATQVAFAAEQWQRHNRDAVARWISVLGELEALSSLAAFAFEHPGATFPEIVSGRASFEAHDVRHPLMMAADCTPNSVILGTNLRLLIVSGSNMSGKSTLLRTIGINVVLAQAGTAVCASNMRLSPFAIGASIRIQDSLRKGKSRFYAEISRFKAIVDMTDQKDCRVLFLFDEMLSGTNYYDRAVGAEAVLRCLVDAGAIGIITTHDLTLTELTKKGLPAANVHFQDEIDNGQIIFDHVLKSGIVQHSNALELMRSIGLRVPDHSVPS